MHDVRCMINYDDIINLIMVSLKNIKMSCVLLDDSVLNTNTFKSKYSVQKLGNVLDASVLDALESKTFLCFQTYLMNCTCLTQL